LAEYGKVGSHAPNCLRLAALFIFPCAKVPWDGLSTKAALFLPYFGAWRVCFLTTIDGFFPAQQPNLSSAHRQRVLQQRAALQLQQGEVVADAVRSARATAQRLARKQQHRSKAEEREQRAQELREQEAQVRRECVRSSLFSTGGW
jgi:hypothetical protein